MQFVALAKQQGTKVPLMIGHRLDGHFPAVYGATSRKGENISIRRLRFTILQSIVRWRRYLVDIVLSCLSLVGSVVSGLSRGRARRPSPRAQGCAEIGQATMLMVALNGATLTASFAAITRKQTRGSMNLSHLANEKGALLWKAWGMMNQGWLMTLTGKSSNAVRMTTSSDHRIPVNGSHTVYAIVLVKFGKSLCRTQPI